MFQSVFVKLIYFCPQVHIESKMGFRLRPYSLRLVVSSSSLTRLAKENPILFVTVTAIIPWGSVKERLSNLDETEYRLSTFQVTRYQVLANEAVFFVCYPQTGNQYILVHCCIQWSYPLSYNSLQVEPRFPYRLSIGLPELSILPMASVDVGLLPPRAWLLVTTKHFL